MINFSGKMDMMNFNEIKRNKGLQIGGKLQKAVDTLVLKHNEPYMPKDTGKAIQSGLSNTNIGSGEVTYSTPYIKEIYYSNKNYVGSPQRGYMWFERMKTDKKEAIAKEVNIKIK